MEILQIYQLVFCNSSALHYIYLLYRIQSYTLSQFPASITSAYNITWVWYDCKAWNVRLHVWKLPYLYLTHVQYFKHVFKPHRTINNDLNISHNQQSTTRAWMHARMLPNYLCYESVGLVCFVGFVLPEHWCIQVAITIIWNICNPLTVYDKAMYIWLCSQQKDKRNLLVHK